MTWPGTEYPVVGKIKKKLGLELVWKREGEDIVAVFPHSQEGPIIPKDYISLVLSLNLEALSDAPVGFSLDSMGLLKIYPLPSLLLSLLNNTSF